MYESQKPEKALPESAQLQWAIHGMGAYSTLKVRLALKEKLDDKHDSVLARVDESFNALQEKINDKSNMLLQSILRSEQSVLNQIKDMQSVNLKWFIGIIAGTGIAFYKVFTMTP